MAAERGKRGPKQAQTSEMRANGVRKGRIAARREQEQPGWGRQGRGKPEPEAEPLLAEWEASRGPGKESGQRAALLSCKGTKWTKGVLERAVWGR